MRPGEAASLTWEGFDEETWTVRLPGKYAKTGRPRGIACADAEPLRAVLERRLAARRMDSLLIFHRTSKGKPGQRIRDFSFIWAEACKAAGLPAGRKGGITPYDLRRSGVRNMIRAGVSQTVAMRVSGHVTDATFRRYDITSEADVAEALSRTADYVMSLPKERKVVPFAVGENRDNSGTIGGQPLLPRRQVSVRSRVYDPRLGAGGGTRTHTDCSTGS